MDQLADAGVVDLAVSGGEPLLRRDLLEIIAHARNAGLSVGVGSNGAKLTKAQASNLAAASINRFQVSLDGFQAAHEALRRWPGLFARALASIELAASAGLDVTVCCTINKLNFTDLEAFAEFVSTTPARRLNLSRYVPTGRGTDALDLTDAQWHSLIPLTAILRKRYHGKLDVVNHLAQQIFADAELEDMRGFIGCQAGRGQGCVTANGTVWPCVLLPIALGNVRERSFRRIWMDSPVVHELQDRDQLRGVCATCCAKDRCGGCRAVAYARTGDYLAADPRCWFVNGCEVISTERLKRRDSDGYGIE